MQGARRCGLQSTSRLRQEQTAAAPVMLRHVAEAVVALTNKPRGTAGLRPQQELTHLLLKAAAASAPPPAPTLVLDLLLTDPIAAGTYVM